MVLIPWGRAWRLLFAAILVCVFAGYCVFWRQTFVKNSAMATPTAADSCATSCPNRAVPLFGEDEEEALFDGPNAEGADSKARDGKDPQTPRRGGRPRSFRPWSSLGGPYSLAVRAGLGGVLLPEPEKSRYAGLTPMSLGVSSGSSVPAFTAPTYGYITSGFGLRRSPFHGGIVQHRGVDFAVPYGADVFATADGAVVFAGWSSGLGRTVVLEHGGGVVTRYAHASRLLVEEGDTVRRGDVIAHAGNSGRSTGTHLHYEVWLSGGAVDPMPFLTGEHLVALAAQDEKGTPAGLGEETNLGLAMGGDAVSLSAVDKAALPRYSGRSLLRGNLLIFSLFMAAALGLMAHLVRHAPRIADQY